ncbi:MAG: hypothetical protein JRJ09_17935 [Deltaproteobacteria bacterium]|nr:hypothetical protein [Deltaproteobacteria bacterium]
MRVLDPGSEKRKEIFEKWHKKFTNGYVRQALNAEECIRVWISLSSMSW